MATLTVKQKSASRKIQIEVDVEQWERISADLGMYTSEFLDSVDRAERDISRGKTKKLKSLRDLHHA